MAKDGCIRQPVLILLFFDNLTVKQASPSQKPMIKEGFKFFIFILFYYIVVR